jgi:hypothetical protein
MIARTVLPTDAPALREFFRGMREAIHVTFEEGTQAQWLYDLVGPAGRSRPGAQCLPQLRRPAKALECGELDQ